MRTNLAQTVVLSLVLAACNESHARFDDAGRPPDDGGPTIIDAGSIDAGTPIDAGLRPGCDADDAHAEVCPEVLCDGPPRWYWNGDDCFWIDCGACRGGDCVRGSSSEAECRAAHASCEPGLCRSTGGDWRWWGEDCGHHVCGYPLPHDCLIGRPSCDCGWFRSFADGVGCVDDLACPIPEPVTREQLCTGTGGAWSPICCDTVCGVPCGDACVAMACECGPDRVFEEARGCIESSRCHEPRRGESCAGNTRCVEGTICCARCGGAGCGTPTCEPPVCDDDPEIDVCGNNLLAP